MIIDSDTWNRTQDRRKQRSDKYIKKLEHKDVNVIKRNDGMLALVDVCHCGYCGCKMVNGSKYSYWTIKDTGEKRASKTPIYKCQTAWQGVPHDKSKQYRADKIEPIVFDALAKYIGKLQENEDIFQEIEYNQSKDKKAKENELKKEKQELANIRKKIDVLEDNIANAITGDYPLSLEQLVAIINKHKQQAENQEEIIRQKEVELKNASVTMSEWTDLREKIPTWQDVFLSADTPTKRVLVDRLVNRINVTKDRIVVQFKINLDNFFTQPRMTDGFGVSKPRL